jgi:hypothetical protein
MRHALRSCSFALLVLAAFACGGSSRSADASTGDDAGTGAESSAPDAAMCATPHMTCAGSCVDTFADPANCGRCAHACAQGATCAAGTCVYDTGTSIVLAIKKLYVGDTDRNGVASAVAWKSYGVNLDGKTTDSTSTDVCTLAAGTPKSAQVDGTGGIDNSFGNNILPIWLTTIGTTFAQKTNDATATGAASTTLLRIDGVTAQPDAALAPGSAFIGIPFGASPKWDGSDIWPIDSSSVTNGDIKMPALAFASGAMTSRVWTAAPPAIGANLPLLFVGDEQVLISDVKISMTIAADGRSAVQGTIAGVMPTNAYIAALQKAAGRISTSLCQGSAFDSIAQQIRQASDILRDGSNMAGVSCDAISIGIGFDATIVKLGEIVTPPVQPNPCP